MVLWLIRFGSEGAKPNWNHLSPNPTQEIESPITFLTGGEKKDLTFIQKHIENVDSSVPIIVYGFNCDVPFDYPNMTKRRIDEDQVRKFDDRDTRLYYKKINRM